MDTGNGVPPISIPLHEAADVAAGELITGLARWQRLEGFTASRQWVDVAELYGRFTAAARARLDASHAEGDDEAALEAADELDLAGRSVVAEIAAALSWSHARAAGQVDVALALTSQLRATLHAVTVGLIDVRRAEVIARVLQREEGELARRVEEEILPEASGWNTHELRERIRKSVLRAAPELAAARAETARRQRGVHFTAEPDDMVRMEALLPVADGVRVQAALDVAAFDQRQIEREVRAEENAPEGQFRSLDQIRADVLVETLAGLSAGLIDRTGRTSTEPVGASAATSGETSPAVPPPSRPRHRRGLRHEVVVTVPLETITGDADEPGYLARYGPISAAVARQMASDVAQDGYWRCAVTEDVHGTLLGLGRSMFTPAYQVPEYLHRFTSLRDRTCDFPGCQVPAAACEFDHTIPHPNGSTCECGGAKRCKGHHRLKHRTRWEVRRSENPQHPPGTQIWTSPTGREYASKPAVIGVPRAESPLNTGDDSDAGETRTGEPPF